VNSQSFLTAPLQQCLTMESVNNMQYKQFAVTEFLVEGTNQ